MLVREPFEV